MDFEAAKRTRDARLRRQMLETLQHARGFIRGGLNGQTLLDVVAAGAADDQGFEDGDHFLRLAADLVNKQLAEQLIENLRRGQRLSPSHLFLKITARGSDLLDERVPPVPGIDDEREVLR